jgi:RNA polymerase sigma-70 factor (ECF subfamily)
LDDALTRARSGDEGGFLELWQSLQPPLLRYLRVLRCADPDDVASETWLQVVRDLHKFKGGENDFRRWLFTIGRHRAIDVARSASRHPVTPAAAGLEHLADEQTVEDQVFDSIVIRKALALLSVARILGKSSGAVRVALHRGLRALADDPRVQALAGDPDHHRPARSPSLLILEEVE